jgi:hypothetical protein
MLTLCLLSVLSKEKMELRLAMRDPATKLRCLAAKHFETGRTAHSPFCHSLQLAMLLWPDSRCYCDGQLLTGKVLYCGSSQK